MPTFILHGEDDKNVPAEQGRQMESYLKRAGNVPEVFYREGGGHWWDGKTAKGADCVDWPGIFDLFRRSRVEKDPTQLKWTTWNPAVDATHHWVTPRCGASG